MDKAILIYTISEDKLRDEFVNELISRGWEEHQDQSTLTLPQNNDPLIFNYTYFNKWIEYWSVDKKWTKDDFIQVFYPRITLVHGSRIPTLESTYFSL